MTSTLIVSSKKLPCGEKTRKPNVHLSMQRAVSRRTFLSAFGTWRSPCRDLAKIKLHIDEQGISLQRVISIDHFRRVGPDPGIAASAGLHLRL